MVQKLTYEELEQKVGKFTKELIEVKKELKKANDTLLKSEDNLTTTQRIAHIGSWDLNVKTGQLVLSDEIFQVFGYKPGKRESDFRYAWDSIHPDDKDILGEVLETAIEKGTPYDMECRIITHTGEMRFIKSIAKAKKDEKGNVVRIYGTAQDITEQKRVEQSLHESQRFNQSIIASLPGFIYIFDLNEKKIIYSNQNIFEILGYTPDEIEAMGNKLLETLFHPDESDLTEKMIERLHHANNGQISTIERRMREKDGTYRWFLLRDTVFKRSSDKEVCQIIGTAYDITDRKLAEKGKQQLEAQLRQSQKMESIGTLAGGIAHDFNNILGIILGNAELTLDKVPNQYEARENIVEVRKASIRAKELIQQLLSFSRKTDQNKEPIEITPVIKEAVKFLRSSIPSTIDIRQNIHRTIKTVMAAPVQIHQVIINLCTNAAYAMRNSGGIIEVSLENIEIEEKFTVLVPTHGPGKYLKLSVRDTGPGITPEIKDNIFDPYFTTKEIGQGTGMGLSVVHGIVKSHGGFITVESEPGAGAKFDIYFPALETEEIHSKFVSAATIPSGNERILFVDDEEKITTMSKQILERLGYQVSSQTSSVEALDDFRTHPDHYDLIITDTTMPKMTGDLLAQKVLEINPDMPIILCTGYSEKIDEEFAKSMGVRALIMKPIEKSELAKTIRGVLDGKVYS